MPTDATFRFSTLLALALSCVAIGYAEFPILPEVAVFSFFTLVALSVLYFLESRVTFLSISRANLLGVAIALIYFLWCAYRIKREMATHEFKNMGWQMLIVALCGPLLMMTIVAKVARTDKHAGDYWSLHGIALAGITMSAAFAEETTSFILVGLYLIATVWSLTLLYLGRASGAIPPIPGKKQPARKAVVVSTDPTGHRTDIRPAILWAALSLVGALPIYLLTPRSDATKIDFGKPRIEVGYAADQMVDLNQAGPLAINGEIAFEFTATNPDGSPRHDIEPTQRWRGKTFRYYSNGEWKTGEEVLPHISHARGDWRKGGRLLLARRVDPWVEPQLGPGQFTITFEVPGKLGGPILADPILWEPDQPVPVAVLTERGTHSWSAVPDGSLSTFYWDRSRGQVTTYRYLQVYRKPETPDVSPPFRFVNQFDDNRLTALRQNPVPRVKEYADGVLKELIDSGQLPKDCRDEKSLLPKPRYREAVARLFTAHLSSTPSLTYTMDLKRGNPAIDPVEDFLFNSREGHCERFSAALALMLRSQGIPSVYVLGFKGCEPVEPPGRYIVRQEFAHAWVEALVPKTDEPEDPKEPLSRVYHWISLDPTPGGEQTVTQNRSWWSEANNWVQQRFQTYVKDYTPEQRRKALAAFITQLANPETLAWIAFTVLLLLVLRVTIRRWRRPTLAAVFPSEANGWFAQLLSLLKTHGMTPATGETLLEYANATATVLRARGYAEVADVPLAWVIAYYQDRFGGISPSDARFAELSSGLDTLRRALEKPGA